MKTIAPKVFAEKINNNDIYLIDVRTPQEYASQHIGNAVNIDINNSNFESQISSLDKNKPVYVYCLSGGRSAKAAQKMNELGFTEVYNLIRWNYKMECRRIWKTCQCRRNDSCRILKN